MNAEERARLRAVAEFGSVTQTTFGAKTLLALLDEVDRLTEALEAAEQDVDGRILRLADRHKDRAEHAEADLADEKRRHAELRAGVEALAEAWGPTGSGNPNPAALRALLSDTGADE